MCDGAAVNHRVQHECDRRFIALQEREAHVPLRRFTESLVFPVRDDPDHFLGIESAPSEKRRPIADCSGQTVAANVWLTMATRGAPAPSRSEKSRPSMIGVPMVRKYHGPTLSKNTVGR